MPEPHLTDMTLAETEFAQTELREHFALTPEQTAIGDLAYAFAQEHMAPYALQWDEERYFPLELFQRAAPLGMGGILVREDVGGSHLDRLAAVRIYDALAQACPTIAAYFTVHNMVAWVIDVFGTPAQRRQWLPSLCRFERLGAYCLSEPAVGSDASRLTTRAVREGDGYVLNGVKQFISGAGAADLYIASKRAARVSPSGHPNARWAGTPSPRGRSFLKMCVYPQRSCWAQKTPHSGSPWPPLTAAG